MKEQLHTIPVNEAFESGDECPFCFLRRQVEQRVIRYVAGPGASYMEPDVRDATNQMGFCAVHTKKLYDYGNRLGAALMEQTYFEGVLDDLEKFRKTMPQPVKRKFFQKKTPVPENPIRQTIKQRAGACYVCGKIDYNMERYFSTFFYLLKEPEFRAKVEASKGFCVPHFMELTEKADTLLPDSQAAWFYDTIYDLTLSNLKRVKEDLDWFIAKHDYRNTGADWKNSQDALPRAMQKMQGLHPSDPPFKME